MRALRATQVLSGFETSKNANANVQSEVPLPPDRLGHDIFGCGRVSSPLQGGNPFSTSTSVGRRKDQLSPLHSPDPDRSDMSEPQGGYNEERGMNLSFAEKVKISGGADGAIAPSTVPWPPRVDLPRPFPTYHLDADYEILEPISSVPPQKKPPISLDEKPVAEASASDAGRAFESVADETFQRFADRLAQNPLQVLRYEYRGSPLLYSNADGIGARLSRSIQEPSVKTKRGAGATSHPDFPACGRCGSQRVFELQLTPQAITEVEKNDTGLEGMEWGTLIIAVCSSDCHAAVPDGETFYTDEWVGVQWEEKKH